RAERHERPADPDRDHLVYHVARRDDGGAHPDHRQPLGWSAVLRQLLPDGLRTDGGRCARGNESAKLGLKPFLPPVLPFDSRQWPMRITPGPGPASLADPP